MTRVIGAHHVCHALEHTLEQHLDEVVALIAAEDPTYADLGTVHTWDQVPTVAALTKAKLPAGAIVSPGLVEPPTRQRTGTHATWRVAVGVYSRGTSYTDTANRAHRWAAAVRATIELQPSLGGFARATTWVSEEYAEIPQADAARTLAGCVVAFDVDVRNVTDLSGALPVVTTPLTSVSPMEES